MNSYEQKQEARRERLEAAADKAEAKSNAAYARSDLSEGASGIPFGQPILVGHHSEARHRRAIAKADSAMRQSVEHSQRASELRGKAASVGTGGISSDDPDAPEKLAEKLETLKANQDYMKAANRIMRAAMKAGCTHETDADAMADWGHRLDKITDRKDGATVLKAIMAPDFAGRHGFPGYRLTNNNAEIRRLEKRIADLEKASDRETQSENLGPCVFIQNAEENRLQFVFEGKPVADIRHLLKCHGFRWAPSQNAWQRKWTNNAAFSARLVINQLTEAKGGETDSQRLD